MIQIIKSIFGGLFNSKSNIKINKITELCEHCGDTGLNYFAQACDACEHGVNYLLETIYNHNFGGES